MFTFSTCGVLDRETLLELRHRSHSLDVSTRQLISSLKCARRGCRAGRHVQLRPSKQTVCNHSSSAVDHGEFYVRGKTTAQHIPVIQVQSARFRKPPARERTLISVAVSNRCTVNVRRSAVPALYVLNAAALSKPRAVEHLTADLISYGSDVAVITETHLKLKHSDSVVAVDGYSVFRRDRPGRRGGGVAVYVKTSLQPTVWNYSQDDRSFELLWIRTEDTFVGALYHPPKPIYQPDALMSYLESSLEEICRNYPTALIVLAGDFNQLADQLVCERTGLLSIVHQPTRGQNVLDRIYVSSPSYSVVRVVVSVVKSDHQAVVAYADVNQCHQVKTTSRRTYRKKTPAQHAQFLQHAAAIDFGSGSHQLSDDVQNQFDSFYDTAMWLLDRYYPEHTVTVTNRDPPYITAHIKAMLRRKNRLMRKGRIEEASALAQRIGKAVTLSTKTQLTSFHENIDSGQLWSCVRRLTGKRQNTYHVEGITAQSLNEHYCKISTDCRYRPPLLKHSVSMYEDEDITEWQVFESLDNLRPTSTGLDKLPAWFLRLGAPIFSKPLSELFNLSLSTSTVPHQWKQAWIRPVPKVPVPTQHSDYRPISITPVLTRVMEKIVVRRFIYPALLQSPAAATLSFSDQFAYRPTGSTTAALIAIFHTVTHLLVNNPYVIVIALDFSKAFDTVRHWTLLEKMAQLDLPDTVYNWLANFFSEHSHQTRYNGSVSELKQISASIIQGSAIGPTSYVVNASDLRAITDGNELLKYADDTYLVVPAVNAHSRCAELQHITSWAAANNLTLNLSKSEEIIFVDKRRKRVFDIPMELPDLRRVHTLKVLGVTVSNGFSVSQHIQNVITTSAQTLYALRVLRAHGMSDSALQAVYRAVVLARLLYASPAWWGFTSSKDRQRVYAFMGRSTRTGFLSPDLPNFDTMCAAADQKLFGKVLGDSNHVLHRLLPRTSNISQHYSLRPRPHDRFLPDRLSHLVDCNFIVRMLFCDIY